MLKLMENSTDKILSIKASGTVSHEDYEAFIPLIDAKIQSGEHIYLLADITELEGMTPHAMLDDFLGGMKYWWNFEAVAIIGNQNWEKALAKIGHYMTPADVKYFDAHQKADAMAWLSAQ